MSSTTDNILTTNSSVLSMSDDELEAKMKLLDNFYGEEKTENELSELGLFPVYAYYCQRCNHVWLPRRISGPNPFLYPRILGNMEPPKSCAKCKSKYWNRIPQRVSK